MSELLSFDFRMTEEHLQALPVFLFVLALWFLCAGAALIGAWEIGKARRRGDK